MKKLLNTLALSFLILFFIACGNESNEEDNILIVKKSDVSFDANGGAGTIEIFTMNNIVKAISDTDWCKPEVSGNIITLTVSVNQQISSRTALIKIFTDANTIEIAVNQAGAIFSVENVDYLYFLPEGGDARISFNSILPLNIDIKNNWIEHKIIGDEIVFTAKPMRGDIPRTNRITIASGLRSTEIPVSQNSFASLLGDWKMFYTDIDGIPTEKNVKLETYVEDQSYMMSGLPLGAVCLVQYNSDNGHLILSSRQYLGTLDGYHVYFCVSDPSAGEFTMLSTAQYEGFIDWDKSDDAFALAFGDNGTWENYVVREMSYTAFTAKYPYGIYQGDYERLTDISMIKQ